MLWNIVSVLEPKPGHAAPLEACAPQQYRKRGRVGVEHDSVPLETKVKPVGLHKTPKEISILPLHKGLIEVTDLLEHALPVRDIRARGDGRKEESKTSWEIRRRS